MSNPKQREGLFSTIIDGQVIIYDPTNNQSHCLSPVARHVWTMCDGQHDPDEMAHHFRTEASQELDVDNDEVENIIDTTLELLAEQNLLTTPLLMSRRDFGRHAIRPALSAALMVTLFVASRSAHASTSNCSDLLDQASCEAATPSCFWLFDNCVPNII